MAGFLGLDGLPPLGLWDSAAETIVINGARRQRALSNAQYRQLQRDLHDLYDDEHYAVTYQQLRYTHPRVAERWNQNQGAAHRYLNVVGLVVRTLSVVFHRPPGLALCRAGVPLPATDPAVKQWSRDLRDVSHATKLRTWDLWTSLARTTLMQPSYQTVDGIGRMRWTVHMPYTTGILQGPEDASDVRVARAVSVELPQGTDSRGNPQACQWVTWTRQAVDGGPAAYRMIVHDADERHLGNSLFLDGINRYGVLPFVVARDGEPAAGEFFLPAREPLFRMQTWVNATLCDEGHGLKFQTHATPVLSGWMGENVPTFDPGEPIIDRRNNPAFKLAFVTPQTNLKTAQDALENALRWYAVSEGLPAEIFSGQTGTRNLAAMRMAAHHLGLRREERLPMYREAMTRLFELHRTIGNWHARNTPGFGREVIPEDLELDISFAPIPYPVDEASHINAVAKGCELGTTNAIEEIANRDGISMEAAEIKHARNLEITARTRAALGAPGAEPATTSDSSTTTPPDQAAEPGEPSPNLPGRPTGGGGDE